MKAYFLAVCLLLAACAQTPVAQSRKPQRFDDYHPGGPVYQPRELLVSEPMPADPPFGKYFANDQPPVPPGITNPYWISGYWAWKEPNWDWVPGLWVERPKPGLIWINPRYYRTGGQQYWVTGYWE